MLLIPPRSTATPQHRGVAQPGSALAWGASGRWFKSSRPDSGGRESARVRGLRLWENQMHNPIELELLVRHIGKAKGIELVRLSRIPSAPGIAQAAIDALGAATEGFPGLYGEPSEALHALEDLRERFPN